MKANKNFIGGKNRGRLEIGNHFIPDFIHESRVKGLWVYCLANISILQIEKVETDGYELDVL